MKKTLSLLLLLSIVFSLFSCGDKKVDTPENKDYKTRSRTISTVYFNTFSAVYSYGDESDVNINNYAAIAEEVLSYYHELFDIYYEYAGVNNIRTINKNAGKKAVAVDREMIDFLLYCKELYTLTNGKTNVMLGSVLKIWHDVREIADGDFGYLNPALLPSEEELNAAKEHVSIDSLIIDETAGTVYISDPNASLDVGAIAKGYTVEILYKRLVSEGADSVALNIGGNLRTIGLKPDGSLWMTGLTNPDKSASNSVKCRIEIGSSSMVTSGDYERFFYAGNTKYHHIIDPETLMPAAYFSSVTIITENSGLADALSTALFCMSYEEGLALVNSIGGIEVVWIDLDYNVKTTPGINILPIE